MILHTTASPYMIFPQKETPIKYYKLKNGYAEYEIQNGKEHLRRINSTDLKDYLRRH